MGWLTAFYIMCGIFMIIIGLTALPFGVMSIASGFFLIWFAKWEAQETKLEQE